MRYRNLPEPHEVAKLEHRYRLFFFLRDLGIKSATEASDKAWHHYMYILGELTVGG